ncbi:hypothetical protein QVD17_16704 [Tagetes erecta]|uniref:Uncharacterized protein n=1 Tax=Tagetes erecta TaxID=13708 RepID=A0AAD8KUP1_TARER|nr:hypothetical protein QVD17_16704 [Tagetes erecta]
METHPVLRRLYDRTNSDISFLFDFERLCGFHRRSSHLEVEQNCRFMVYVSEFSFSGAVDWENNHLQKRHLVLEVISQITSCS